MFLESCKKRFFVRNLQVFARNKLSVYTLRSDNLCISPKYKHNQPLEVKCDEIYTCWTYFVLEHVQKHQGYEIFWNHMFCDCLICLKRNTKWNNFYSKLLYLVFLAKIILVVFWNDAKRLVLNRLLDFFHIFVEGNTNLWKVSDTFSAITKTLWTRFVQTEYNSCKIFCKSGVFFTRFTRFKQIWQEFVDDNAFSCKMLLRFLQ